MSSSSTDALLLDGLRAEAAAFQEFQTTLQAEQKALIDGDIAALTALSKSKVEHVNRLNQLAAARMEHIVSLGLSANRHGIEQWVEHTGAAAADAWRAALAIASEAHQTNQINGNLIQTRLQHNQQALSVLLAAVNQANNLYGADGQPTGLLGNNVSRSGIIEKA